MEQNNIGWSWWPLKKIGSVVDPATITFTKGYSDLLAYWKGKAPRPSVADAQTILMDLTEKLKIENCTINYDLIDAMFRQPFTNETAPYANLAIPGKIFATQFDFGKNGFAYSDNSYQNISGIPTNGGNKGGLSRNDGVDIQMNKDSSTFSNGFHIFEIEKNEWVKYSINLKKQGFYDVALRVSNGSNKDGYLHFEQFGKRISKNIKIEPTGGDSIWKTVIANDIQIKFGSENSTVSFSNYNDLSNYLSKKQSIVVKFDRGGFNLSSLNWTGPTSGQKNPFSLLDVRTDEKGKTFQLSFNDAVDQQSVSANGLSFTTNKKTLTF
jgi:hypothetical protein